MKHLAAAAFVTLVLFSARQADAQLTGAKDGPIVYGHVHLSSSNSAEQLRFWVDTLGGVRVQLGTGTVLPPWTPETSKGQHYIKFRNVFVHIFGEKPASLAGSAGSTVDHVALQVPDLDSILTKITAAHFPIITSSIVAGETGKTGIAMDRELNARVAYVQAPDKLRVEFVERKTAPVGVSLDHIHFAAPSIDLMEAWYVKTFGARPGRNGMLKGADLPAVPGVLTFAAAEQAPAGTKGRVLDHIGFEIRNLEAFVKEREAEGVKFDIPYTYLPNLHMGYAFLTDPWGTYIELIEGFARVE
jgi:catechol 2,3-dioxygenase-like lactoylglutathione lyase family enzyme